MRRKSGLLYRFYAPEQMEWMEENFDQLDLPILPGQPGDFLAYRHLRAFYRSELTHKPHMHLSLVYGYSWEVQCNLRFDRVLQIRTEDSVVNQILQRRAEQLRFGFGLARFNAMNFRKDNFFPVVVEELAKRIGQEINVLEISRLVGCNEKTVQKFVDVLEWEGIVYRLRGLRRFSDVEIGRRYKVYFWDLGLRNALINDFSYLYDRSDAAALWENFFINERIKVLVNLKRAGRRVRFYYWRHRKSPSKPVHLVEELANGQMNAYQTRWITPIMMRGKFGPLRASPVLPPFFEKHYPDVKVRVAVPQRLNEFLLVPERNLRTIIHELNHGPKI